jgi:hypothetical protein
VVPGAQGGAQVDISAVIRSTYEVGLKLKKEDVGHRRQKMTRNPPLNETRGKLHALYFHVLHCFEPQAGVIHFRLSRDPRQCRMLLTHTTCPRLQHIIEPILTEPYRGATRNPTGQHLFVSGERYETGVQVPHV